MDTQPGGPQLRILVAAHKPYWMPSDPCYIPVQVGAAQHAHIEGYAHDDTGDNISSQNPRYCELTALWWGWRNLDCDYLGLVHYRRHFAGKGERGTLESKEAWQRISHDSVIVARHRNYMIETIYSHYKHTFDPDGSQLAALRESIKTVSPSKLHTYDRFMAGRCGHMFNMCIMPHHILDPYCTWMFDVLKCAEKKIDFSEMDDFAARCMGRLSERLLDVWLLSEGIEALEIPVKNLEGDNLLRKGSAFLAAKFFGKTYKKSF